jgi:hypothetical protein
VRRPGGYERGSNIAFVTARSKIIVPLTVWTRLRDSYGGGVKIKDGRRDHAAPWAGCTERGPTCRPTTTYQYHYCSCRLLPAARTDLNMPRVLYSIIRLRHADPTSHVCVQLDPHPLKQLSLPQAQGWRSRSPWLA